MPDGSGRVNRIETENGYSSYTTLVKNGNGIFIDYSVDAGFPPDTAKQIGLIREYASPTYAIGESRTFVRQGTWNEDLDGDAKMEQFSFEFSQTYMGLQSFSLSNQTVTTARYNNVHKISIKGSLNGTTAGIIVTEEVTLAQNLGPVKITRKISDLQGNTLIGLQTWTLARLTVNGVAIDNTTTSTTTTLSSTSTTVSGTTTTTVTADASNRRIDLHHTDLVYDTSRDVYYAAIPSSVVGNGNSIAVINPSTGAVSYSAAIGSDPYTLAIAADNSYLYVGLNGAGQVVKLSLPHLAEISRVSLGTASMGTLFADRIAVSPANSNLFAVSLRYQGVSPRHAGVILINGTTIAPNKTQDHTGSNLIAFDSNGTILYGYNNETTEFGLRKIAVNSNGLTEMTVVNTNGSFGIDNLYFYNGDLYLSGSVYSSVDLSLKGQYKSDFTICRQMPNAAKSVCTPSLYSSGAKNITIHGTASFVTQAGIPFAYQGDLRKLVPGPSGQIAVSGRDNYSANAGNYIYLVASDGFK
ncbi:hypothetical protein D3878_21820 [Noviherbaspirillum sedimenti]|uniref:Uncharacterized protein n=1 Tax=Noviherbaspirillum sedimenti TaxID=2320865 RepID=A0A3A3G7W5_9BURK|nr:hypothetical protein D3878_21820 [Noviherbaspirillum sedimenti]